MYDWDADNAEYTTLPGGNLTLHKTKSTTAVANVDAENDAVEVARYDAAGRSIRGAGSGLHIIRMSDGTTRKVAER